MSERQQRSPRFHGRVPRADQCDEPGCRDAGEFRAPLSSPSFDGPGQYRWLCLDHVREFNARYNWFAGMSPEEIDAAQHPAAGWERASRAFATNGDPAPKWADFRDPLDAIQGRFRRGPREELRTDGRALSGDERRALKVLGLGHDVDRRALRLRYSELVRRFHPDRNGGDRSHEGELQSVVEAYQRLKGSAVFA